MTEVALENVDILIIGAGPVGMTLHLALAAGGQKSLLLDRRPLHAQQGDPRALALSHGARQLLEPINSWPARWPPTLHPTPCWPRRKPSTSRPATIT